MPEDIRVPWEREGETFDADKAKAFLTSLKANEAKLIQERDSYKSRLDDVSQGKKDSSKELKEVQAENLRLKVQMQTGFTDQNMKRLVGSTEEELLEDAQAFAEETGLEIRSFIPAGTPDENQGGQDDEDQNGEPKTFSTNYRTPQNQHRGDAAEPDYQAIIESVPR